LDEENESIKESFDDLIGKTHDEEKKKKFEEDKKIVTKIYNIIDVIKSFFNIKSLNEEFGISLEKHHEDYLISFKLFMKEVLRDFEELKEKLKQTEKEKIKNNNHQIIITERDYFRKESQNLKNENIGEKKI